MRQGPGGQGAHRGGYADSRARISAIHEPLPGRDEQLGQIFLNMRRAMNVSRDTIARRLATRTSTIEDFEAGAITALPHWKETQRIVRGYCELLRLDPEPILWRIRSHLDSAASYPRPAPVRRGSTGPATVRTGGRPASTVRSERTDANRPRGDGRRRVRTLFTLSAPIVVLAGIVYAVHAMPQVVFRAVARLPEPVAGPVRAGLEQLLLLTAPRREGLRWIEVGDPQLRKADRLR